LTRLNALHPAQKLWCRLLPEIARALVEKVKANTTIDWTVEESVQSKMRVIVKRILRKYGHPPDKQDKAIQTVLDQSKLLADDWAQAV
jgi:type I restriction enzyme R subunit